MVFGALKRLFGKSDEKYAIYRYDEDRGRWYKVSNDFDYYITPEQANFQDDGAYQLRKVYPRNEILWTVRVEDGMIYEADPSEFKKQRRIKIEESQTPPDPAQMMQMMMETMKQTIAPTLQFMKMQKELLEELGLIKDPKKELLETMTMLKELKEIKESLYSVIADEDERKKSKVPDDAPWWAKMVMESLALAPQLAQLQQPYYNPYMMQQPVQQIPQQQVQPQQQPTEQQSQQSEPQQQEQQEITFNPPPLDEVEMEKTIEEADKEVKQMIKEEATFTPPEPEEPKVEEKPKKRSRKSKKKEENKEEKPITEVDDVEEAIKQAEEELESIINGEVE